MILLFVLDAYSTENLNFNWNPVPVTVDPRLMLSQFDLGQMSTLRCDKQYNGGMHLLIIPHVQTQSNRVCN
jgi:hypothetical protein